MQPSVSDTQLSAPIHLSRVQQLFAHPARVAPSQFLRREIAQRMQERLVLMHLQANRIADMGCGEGADRLLLETHYPQADIVGVDISEAMLSVARQHNKPSLGTRLLRVLTHVQHHPEEWVCSNFAELPFKKASLDMIWSNLALHWHPAPDRVFREWARVLRVEGLLMFTSFGPDTCRELRFACDAAGLTERVLPFVDMHDLGDMLVQEQFMGPVMDMEQITLTYATPQQLLTDVRALGGNPLTTRSRSLLGKQQYQRLCDALMSLRDSDQKIPLTIEVVYGHAFRRAERHRENGEAIVQWHGLQQK